MGSAPEALKRPPEKSCGCGSKMSDKGVRFLKNEIKNDLFISHFNIQDIYLRWGQPNINNNKQTTRAKVDLFH